MFNGYGDIVGVEELCEMLGCGKNTAYKILKSKKIKYLKLGKIYKIPKAWVIEYINSQVS